MNNTDREFWQAAEALIHGSETVIDRPKNTCHPKYRNCIYPVDYGYLKNTSSMDGEGIDVWKGDGNSLDAVAVSVDLIKKDSEIKLIIGCTEAEIELIEAFHNNSRYMKAIIIRRERQGEGWQELYEEARKKLNPRTVSHFIEAGGVAAAILTDKGNIYTGVCIDTASTLGMCAERNAIANMLTNGESRITKLVCIMGDGSIGSPCGACREYLMQLDRHSPEIEILKSLDPISTVKLEELIPDWWGEKYMNESSK